MKIDERTTVAGSDGPVSSATFGDLSGQTLDDCYAVIRRIGAGSMGDVYEARELASDRRVAIKVLKPERVHRGVFLERFLREARSASLVRHPNVVEIYAVGQVGDGPIYFAMEYLEGEDLSQLLERETRLSWSRARPILVQLASALSAAHARGIIHRDIKPPNCRLVPGPVPGQSHVKLVDFGVAKLGMDSGTRELTRAADVIGTVLYMSPEQAVGDAVDARTDVYALGVVAYEMVTGQVTFPGTDIFQVMSDHLRARPRSPRELVPELPIAVEQAILRALEKDPGARFQTMDEFRRALDDVLPDVFDEEPTSYYPKPSDSFTAHPGLSGWSAPAWTRATAITLVDEERPRRPPRRQPRQRTEVVSPLRRMETTVARAPSAPAVPAPRQHEHVQPPPAARCTRRPELACARAPVHDRTTLYAAVVMVLLFTIGVLIVMLSPH